MRRSKWFRLIAVLLAFGIVAAACGSDSGDDLATAAEAEVPAAEAEVPAAEAEEPAAEAEEPAGEATDLSAVCPSPLVVQSDWFPEAEHGALYELVGDDYTVDVDNKIVTGTMTLGGEDLGIQWEVRTGGPAIGYAPVPSRMYTNDDIHLGYASTEGQIVRLEEAPLLSVVAPLETNPQMIMWDPETYPDIETIADLGEAGVTINVFSVSTWAEILVAQGVLNADQLDPSYEGGPARFISEGGKIAQQGFASAEVFTYENVFENWGKPVAFQLVHDAGFQPYSQTIGIKPDDLEELRPCLVEVVPIIQQAVIDFYSAPDRANAIIVDAVEQFADFWVYTPELAEFSVQAQRDNGNVGNGPDGVVGNMDAERVQVLIDQIIETGIDIPDDITVDDIFTNEFIDESIGF